MIDWLKKAKQYLFVNHGDDKQQQIANNHLYLYLSQQETFRWTFKNVAGSKLSKLGLYMLPVAERL